MAQSPCRICGIVPPGSLRKSYLSFYFDEELVRYRLDTCSECAGELREPYERKGFFRDGEHGWVDGPRSIYRPVPLPEPPAEGKKK